MLVGAGLGVLLLFFLRGCLLWFNCLWFTDWLLWYRV